MTTAPRRSILLAVMLGLGLAAFGVGSAVAAEQCRDDKGRFIKCPPPAATAGMKCRDMQTKKFARCGTQGTEPVPPKKN